MSKTSPPPRYSQFRSSSPSCFKVLKWFTMESWHSTRPFKMEIHGIHGGFLKWGLPQKIIYFNRNFHHKQSIFRYPLLWKPQHEARDETDHQLFDPDKLSGSWSVKVYGSHDFWCLKHHNWIKQAALPNPNRTMVRDDCPEGTDCRIDAYPAFQRTVHPILYGGYSLSTIVYSSFWLGWGPCFWWCQVFLHWSIPKVCLSIRP